MPQPILAGSDSDHEVMSEDPRLDSALLAPSSSDREAIGRRRVLVRFAAFALTLLVLDAALGAWRAEPDYTNDWRMPRKLPTAELAGALEAVELAAAGDGVTVAFTGASPTWGDAVPDDHATVPAWFARSAVASGAAPAVFNLASNGQLLGDQYFIARRVADDVDITFVQLTYHAFNTAWREGKSQRYPEIPRLTGVPITPDVAAVLAEDETVQPDVAGSADRWLRDHWRLYGLRDSIAAAAFGSTPEKRLFDRWQLLVLPDFLGEEEVIPSGRPFDELDPDVQMTIVDEFVSAGDYDFDASDSEARMLEQLAADLEADGTVAVFYLSPLNVGLLEQNDVFDRRRYERNVGRMRAIVERHGHRFLDLNEPVPVPTSAFADVNHTTAQGGRIVAQRLWVGSSDLLGVKR